MLTTREDFFAEVARLLAESRMRVLLRGRVAEAALILPTGFRLRPVPH